MACLIKRSTDDALIAHRSKQYEAVILNGSYDLPNSPWYNVLFLLLNPPPYHRALLKVNISFDQSRHLATAAGLQSQTCAWRGLPRQNSFGYLRNSTPPAGPSTDTLGPRDDWLPERLSPRTSHFLCTQTRTHQAWGECDRRAREWQLSMLGSLAEGVSF